LPGRTPMVEWRKKARALIHLCHMHMSCFRVKRRRLYDFAVSTHTIVDTRATGIAISIHVWTFQVKKDESEHELIPDRRFSSKKISVEGVLWSSQRCKKRGKGRETHLNEL
jgi:hypothetical protein